MRIKIITALTLFFIFSLVLSTQFTQLAEATNPPMTGPTTGPTTGPVTGPVTSPASMFKITGKVTYHFLGLLKKGAARFMPAAGVTVKAEDIFNHHKVTTMTDGDGNYVLDPGQEGFYKVSVSGGETSHYMPPLRFIHDKKGKDHVDFQGLIFRFDH